jgi:hypothetical protein
VPLFPVAIANALPHQLSYGESTHAQCKRASVEISTMTTSHESGKLGIAIWEFSFPAILVLFEWGLRQIVGVNAWEFMGPTLAAAAVSFLVPLTKPKWEPSPVGARELARARAVWDEDFVSIMHVFILLFLFAWLATCYVSLMFSNKVVGVGSRDIPLHIIFGALLYFISLVFTWMKEKL